MLSLVRHFSRSKYRVYAAFPEEGPLVEAVKGCGAQAIVLNWSGISFPVALWQLVNVLKKTGINVIHSHDTRTNLLGRLAGRRAGAAIISTYHMPVSAITDMRPLKKAIYGFPDRLTFRLCDRAIAVSDAVRRKLIDDGYPDESRLEVIYNGVDLSRFYIGKRAQHIVTGPPAVYGPMIVGTVARLSPEKSLETLIRAMLKVTRVFPKARCIIAGDGPMSESLQKLAAELGLEESCIFTGYRDDVPSLLSVMDVFVLTSTVEGLPTSLLEAMAMGKPVVATRVGGVPEIVEDGNSGILIEPGDEKRIAEAIITLLKDRDMRRCMGMAGRERVKNNFDLNLTTKRIEELYLKALSEKNVVPSRTAGER